MDGLKTKINVKDIGIVEALLAFYTLFMYDLGHVFYLNIIWIFYFFYLLLNKRVLIAHSNFNALFFLSAFIFLGVVSILTYNILYYHFEIRQFISIIFTTQYIFLIMDIYLDKDRLEKWTVFFAIVLCCFILFLFFSKGYYKNLMYWGGLERTWGKGIIPGFPTNVVIPLLYALYICVKKKYSIVIIFIISLSTFIIPSRIGQLGISFVLMYYFFKLNTRKKIMIVTILSALVILIIGISHFGSIFLEFLSKLMARYGKGSNADRNDIYYVVYQYFKFSPLIGYGGNTLDTLSNVLGNFSVYNIQWPHTHNWILEFLIRYGFLATSFFCVFVYYVCKRAKKQNNLFFCCLLLGCGLFETYMQYFNFIFILMSLVSVKELKQFNTVKL